MACQRKREKTAIIRSLIDEVFSQGGRFLKRDLSNKLWYDGGLDAAKVRVSVGFRDARDPDKLRSIKDMMASLGNSGKDMLNKEPTEKSLVSSNQGSSLAELAAVTKRESSPSVPCAPTATDAIIGSKKIVKSTEPAGASPRSLSSESTTQTRTSPRKRKKARDKRRQNVGPLAGSPPSPVPTNASNNDTHDVLATARLLLEAIAKRNDSGLAVVDEEKNRMREEEDSLEEMEEIEDASDSKFWSAFKRELPVRKRSTSSISEEETSSKEESLFSDETLNEIFGAVDDPIVPWESLMAEDEVLMGDI